MRYSPEDLTEMAITTVMAERIGDPRAAALYMRVSQRSGLAPEVVRSRIHQMTGIADVTE